MKLAFTTLACPSWSLEQAVDQALRSGYEGLELRLLDGELLRSNLDSVVRGRVRSVCAEAGIPIVCIDTSVRIAQPDPVEREAHIREGLAFLELAAEWDAPLIRVFGGPPAGIAEADALAGARAWSRRGTGDSRRLLEQRRRRACTRPSTRLRRGRALGHAAPVSRGRSD